MLLNCGVGEDSWGSLGLQGDPTSPFWRRSALGFLWRNDAKAETPVLWPPHGKSWLTGKDSDAGRDWGQEEKGTPEDEMVGWHHRLDGEEFEWTPGVGDGQGGLVCWNSWGHKELDTNELLNRGPWFNNVLRLIFPWVPHPQTLKGIWVNSWEGNNGETRRWGVYQARGRLIQDKYRLTERTSSWK